MAIYNDEDKLILNWAFEKILRGAGVKEHQYQSIFTDLSILNATATYVNFFKEQGNGIKIENSYAWEDLLGDLSLRTGGAGRPSLQTFIGGSVQAPFFAANDNATLVFHIPHDYVIGSDLYIHSHWAHNGTAISGNLVLTFKTTYAKGHAQAEFYPEITTTLTIPTPNIGTIPRWNHRLDEIQLSSLTPTANQMDSSLLEPDGILFVNVTATTIPTITGGSTNQPAIFFTDIHYQSTGTGTISKSPDFWLPHP